LNFDEIMINQRKKCTILPAYDHQIIRWLLHDCNLGPRPQIREQISGPKISQYEKSILGCGPLVWAGLWNKGVLADYEQLLRPVFSLFRDQKRNLIFFWKHHSVRTEKLHRKKVKKIFIFFGKIFFFQKNHFFLVLNFEWNLSVNTVRSGTDYCWLYCGRGAFACYCKK